jgi:peptidoglycan/xylan/chitin deacetylase (PgdA/CDA1 family)
MGAGHPAKTSRKKSWWRRLRLPLAVTGPVLLAPLSLNFYQPRWVVEGLERRYPTIVFRVHTSDPVVALTFDDGPDDDVTPRVLEILRRENVPATFFLIGERARMYPSIAQDIVRAGHDVGNHLWEDSPEWSMSIDAFGQALRATETALPPSPQPLLHRPAAGFIRAEQLQVAVEHGYRIVLGSAYAGDAQGPPQGYILWALSRMADPGGILILHVGPGRSRTPALLPELIARLRARGLSFVTVRDLLGRAR